MSKNIYDQFIDDNKIKPYKEFVYPYYANKDPAHDFKHIERIISRLEILSSGFSYPIDRERLYFLTCFHELSSKLKKDSKFREKTAVFLGKLGWDGDQINKLFISLDRHIDSPKDPEEKIVHDANFIEVFGAFGIAKAFTTGGAKGQSFEETVDFYEDYIEKIEFQTPMGKRLMEARREYTEDFLRQLKEEW